MGISDIASELVNGNLDEAAEKLKEPSIWVAIVIAIGVLVVVLLVIRQFGKKAKEKFNAGQQATVAQVILNTIRLFVVIVFVITLMNILGINVSGVSAFIGIIVIVIGLAIQDFLKDIIMGIHILTDKFFDVGDTVLYDGIEGTVEEFTLTSTKIKALADGSDYSVANRNVEKIQKLSNVINIRLLIALEEEVENVEKVLKAACPKITAVDGIESAKFLGFDGYASSGSNYLVQVCLENASDRLPLRRAALRVLNIELRENGIEIPYEHVVITKKAADKSLNIPSA